ncbi:MAG: endopeptidase La [Deltaproteobacteria bacterium]|nr:endopeptidase La [Deltaproteobacteria bacterium]
MLGGCEVVMEDDGTNPDDALNRAPGAEGSAHWFGFEEEAEEVEIGTILPVLPLRGISVFPSAILPLLISRESSLALIEETLLGDRILSLHAQRVAETEELRAEDLYPRGCAARILKMLKYPDGSIRILVQGLRRVQLGETTQDQPYLKAKVELLDDLDDNDQETNATRARVIEAFSRLVELTPYLADELQVVAINVRSAGKVADLVAANVNLPLEEKQALLETLEVGVRLKRLLAILDREVELLELGQHIQGQVQSEMHRNQKEFYLRQQLKAIQKELGDADGKGSETAAIAERLDESAPPDDVRKIADNELERLAIIPPESAEHTVVRSYVEWLADIPWSKTTTDNLDTFHAAEVLDHDHFGLDKVKDRILEFLAVRQLRSDSRGPILCLVGPPGVGKTSLGRSVARAMGRNFQRISLGGVRDEAEIRGHRRTYVGSMPGRILQALKLAGSMNPVLMLDEVDKLGSDVRGDPSSALLEVLDPEQNSTFRDHYLDVPVDLSRVLFLTTANYLDPIPPALRDRMEVLELPGYSEEEKMQIGRRHLLPRQIEENGLADMGVEFEEEALLALVRDYTNEAGLRNLDREIGSVCRKIARTVSENRNGGNDSNDDQSDFAVDRDAVARHLGPPRFMKEDAGQLQPPGVATGLAWTPNGGEILFVEVSRMAGKRGLLLTGQLGDVMKESAQAALSFLRANAPMLGLDPDFFEHTDLHLHVPSGAIPKDGPSAGVTILSAMASAMLDRALPSGLAMTGEITLRGAVLPVGGIKEKVLAARRVGITSLMVPERNRVDVLEIEPELRSELRFSYVGSLTEVLALTLPDRQLASIGTGLQPEPSPYPWNN